MALVPAAIGAAAGVEAQRFFLDTLDQVRRGEGNYIRDGEPESVTSQIGQVVARAACRRYGSGNANPNDKQTERYESACRPYLESIGMGAPRDLLPPFSGGQCISVPYRITFSVRRFNDNTQADLGQFNNTAADTITGPISGVRLGPTQTINGVPRSASVLGVRANGTTQTIASSSGRVYAEPISIVSVVRGDAAPDVCGNPPPVVPPRAPVADPQPPGFRFNPRPGLDINVNTSVAVDGSVTFNIGTGPVTFEPFPDDDGGGAGGGDPGDPTDPGDPGASSDSGNGGESEGEAPEGEELVGLLVEVLSAPPGANTFGRTVETVYRGVGYVRMGYPSRLGVDVSGGTVFTSQFFHAQQRGLTNWAVNANLGYNLRTTPYYRSLEQ